MSEKPDPSEIARAIDQIMAMGIWGGAFRSLVSSLSRHGVVAYRHKFKPLYLSGLGFEAATIVDVGVNRGTPDLWGAFRDRTIVLVEPIEEVLQSAISSYPGYNFIPVAAGAGSTSGELKLNVTPVSGHSTFMNRRDSEGESRIVPVVRLDEYLTSHSLPAPFGIKIDTEGFEVEVLKGCSGIMKDVEFVIAEASIKRIYQGGYKFSDLVAIMASYGFQLLDILSSSGGIPNNMDCLFVKETDRRLIY